MNVGYAMATLGAIAVVTCTGMVPAMADEDRYLEYLNDHGYSALYNNGRPIPRSTTIMYGHYICKNLEVNGDPGSSDTLPQFPLLVDAAQHALCPDMASPS